MGHEEDAETLEARAAEDNRRWYAERLEIQAKRLRDEVARMRLERERKWQRQLANRDFRRSHSLDYLFLARAEIVMHARQRRAAARTSRGRGLHTK